MEDASTPDTARPEATSPPTTSEVGPAESPVLARRSSRSLDGRRDGDDPDLDDATATSADRAVSHDGAAALGAQPPTSPRSGGGVRRRRTGLDLLVIVVLAVGAAILIRAFVLEAYYIPSGSMEPTLMPGDRILVNKLAFDYQSVKAGDIIVFRRPPTDVISPTIRDLVKRVVGLPGQHIASGPDGEVLINGKPLPQPYLTAKAKADPGIPIRPQVIPKGYYFVMGDNRGDSEDSRYFGPIPGRLIVGRVVAIIWPPRAVRIFALVTAPLAPWSLPDLHLASLF